jgi:hypothetical protein
MSPGVDVNELARLLPEDVGGYLRATGWQDMGGYDQVRVWSRPVDGEDVEVLLPVSNQFRDYQRRMVQLLGTLAEVEQRAREDILRDLREPLVDVQYIRTMPDTPSGTTPLTEGAKAIQAVRDLFLAAATSAVLGQDHAVLPAGQKPRPAREFVEQVRLGVPSAGSYVLRIETPIGQVETAGPETESFDTRNLLVLLYRAVRAAHTAAVETAQAGTARPFERQIEHGVSANLCEALADIGGNRRSAFEFRFAWARTVPLSEETPDLRFDAEHVIALHDAKTHLRRLANTEQAIVLGRPTGLQHRDEPTGRVVLEGRIEFADRVEDEQRVVMRLSRPDYDQVVQAHRPEQPALVRVTGLIRASGRQWELVTVEELRIVR